MQEKTPIKTVIKCSGLPGFMIKEVASVKGHERQRVVDFMMAVARSQAMLSRNSYDRVVIPNNYDFRMQAKPDTPDIDVGIRSEGHTLVHLVQGGNWNVCNANGGIDIEAYRIELAQKMCRTDGNIPTVTDGIQFIRKYGYADITLVPELGIETYLVSSFVGHDGRINQGSETVAELAALVELTGHKIDEHATELVSQRLPLLQKSGYGLTAVTNEGLFFSLQSWKGKVDALSVSLPHNTRHHWSDMPEVPHFMSDSQVTDPESPHQEILCPRTSTEAILRYLA